MKPLNANDYLTEHIDHEECAALLVLEPLDVVDRTSKHQAWSRSPLNTGNGKPNSSATACYASRLPSSGPPTDFRPTAEVGFMKERRVRRKRKKRRGRKRGQREREEEEEEKEEEEEEEESEGGGEGRVARGAGRRGEEGEGGRRRRRRRRKPELAKEATCS